MPVPVDLFPAPVAGRVAESTLSAHDDREPQDFARLYALATPRTDNTADGQSLPFTEETGQHAKTDEKDVKKMANEEAAALLMLFLLTRQMQGQPQPPDLSAAQDTDTVEASTDTGEDISNDSVTTPGRIPAKDPGVSAIQNPDSGADDSSKDSSTLPLPIQAKTRHGEKTATIHTAPAEDKTRSAQSPPTAPDSETPQSLQQHPADSPGPSPAMENRPAPSVALQGAPPAQASSGQSLQPSSAAQQMLPLHSAQWSEQLAGRVMWLSSQNLQSAHIELSPKELGTLEVQVALAGGQTEVHFLSTHAEVRTALEVQLPRLQEMLESQGLAAPRLGIFDSSFSGHKEQKEQENGKTSRSTGKSRPLPESEDSTGFRSSGSQALIDYYA